MAQKRDFFTRTRLKGKGKGIPSLSGNCLSGGKGGKTQYDVKQRDTHAETEGVSPIKRGRRGPRAYLTRLSRRPLPAESGRS